jgi:signal transduction histidine kinase
MPARRPAVAPWAEDAAVTVAVFAATLGLLWVGGFGTPDPWTRALDNLGVLLTAASAAPLLLRRVAPFTGYLATVVASVALIGYGYPLDVPLGPLVAVYALAAAYNRAYRPRRWAAFVAVNLFVPATALTFHLRGGDLGHAAPPLLAWAVAFAGLWVVADRNSLRQERLVALEERALRSEREAERERRLAAAQERTRIARELHDSAGHAVNVILVQAGAARLLHETDPERSRRAIATIEDVARGTLGEIDRLVRALRDDGVGEPPAPADPAAFEELLERYRAGGLTISTDLRGSRRALPRSVAWAAYRILQEALTNATRHGRGSAVVAMRFEPGGVEITVTNPAGAARREPRPDRIGHGIVGMRERASLLGGTLDAVADPHGTFRLHARLPLDRAAT